MLPPTTSTEGEGAAEAHAAEAQIPTTQAARQSRLRMERELVVNEW
jgi:hypothetical protein